MSFGEFLFRIGMSRRHQDLWCRMYGHVLWCGRSAAPHMEQKLLNALIKWFLRRRRSKWWREPTANVRTCVFDSRNSHIPCWFRGPGQERSRYYRQSVKLSTMRNSGNRFVCIDIVLSCSLSLSVLPHSICSHLFLRLRLMRTTLRPIARRDPERLE